jgi:predicted nucleic acid-binding protein
MIIDTNILIGYLNRSFPIEIARKIAQIITQDFDYSIVTYIELFGYHRLSDAMRVAGEEALTFGNLQSLSPEIAVATIHIRRTKRLKLPDAVVAATALVLDQPLLTADKRGFQQVPGLKLLRPAELV